MTGRLAAASPTEQAVYARKRKEVAEKALTAAMRGISRDGRSAFGSALRQLDALSPLKVMARGYSLAYDEDEKKLLRSVRETKAGDRLVVRLADGKLSCSVAAVHGEANRDDE